MSKPTRTKNPKVETRQVGRPKVQQPHTKVSVTIPPKVYAEARKRAFAADETFSGRVSRALESLLEMEAAQ